MTDDEIAKFCLPPRNTRRWRPKIKERVLSVLDAGRVTTDQLKDIYNISAEEIDGWRRYLSSHGVGGLKASFHPKHARTQ